MVAFFDNQERFSSFLFLLSELCFQFSDNFVGLLISFVENIGQICFLLRKFMLCFLKLGSGQSKIRCELVLFFEKVVGACFYFGHCGFESSDQLLKSGFLRLK